MSARAVGRLSAQANDIRFGNVQRQDETFRAELRAVRLEAAEPGLDPAALEARLQGLREQVERFAGQWITASPSSVPAAAPATAASAPDASPDPTEAGAAPAAVPAPLGVQQVAGIRQAVTRAMIVLAQAPLHLRLEFGAGFVDPHPDVLLLAARMHAIHRGVRGSLKHVCWQSVDRAELGFGDADPSRTIEAVFDAQGRLQVPDRVRQQSGRGPGPAGGAVADRRDGAGRAPRPGGGRRSDARQGSGPPPGGRPDDGQSTGARAKGAAPGDRHATGGPGRSGQPGHRGPAAGPRSTQGPRPRQDARPPQGPRPPQGERPPQGPRPPQGRGRPRPAGDGGATSASTEGATRARQERHAHAPRRPINPLMADKLRAVLGAAPSETPTSATPATATPATATPATAAPTATPVAAAEPPPSVGPAAPPGRGSD